MKHVFRVAAAEDHERIAELKKQVHHYHYQQRPDHFKLSKHIFPVSYFNEVMHSDQHNIFVMEISNHIVAYAICKIISYDSNPLIVNHKQLFIEDLCVDEKNRNQGIGTTFFVEIEKYCRNKSLRSITLDVWNFNAGAINFYAKIGMRPVIQRFEKSIE